MAYKEKECPKCGVKHTKRGEYCSRSCGNQKSHTELAKIKIAQSQTERMNSGDDVAEEQRYALAVANNREFDPPPVPVEKPVGVNQFIASGDLWTEV